MHDFQTEAVRTRFPLYFRVARHYRNRRFSLFLTLLQVKSETPILDVGGTAAFWSGLGFRNVTLLNVRHVEPRDGIRAIEYAGGRFPMRDGEFEVVFSNSTIEHVGDFWDQQLFASEIQRVGRKYFVQTPSFWFPFETHAHLPFFQFLPSNLKMFLRSAFMRTTYPVEELLSIRLLTKRELRYLFPGATIITERMLLLPKSYYVVKQQ